jgi:CheY-like chemotaxis protein
MGIPETNIDKIFEPFFTTKKQGEGTGLGLSTVLGIVRSHGGFVNVYSEIGRGTEFRIYIPAAEVAQQAKTREIQDDLPRGQGQMILVVDDEAAIREIAKGTLESYGYQVMTASDGTEAVAIYAQRRDSISLVVTDMGMPYMDGVATIRALQKMNPQVKIIATSGLKSEGKNSEALALGITTFLPKPYTADKLLKALSNMIADN